MPLQDIERVVSELAVELANPDWDRAVPPTEGHQRDIPLIVGAGVDPSAMPIPLLHACRRRWGVPQGWTRSCCPICGARPGFAEVCGVERTRYLRCLRCGAAWQAHGLSCVFCGTTEHEKLGSLLPQEGAPKWAIEVCNSCRGYLKVFMALRPSAPERVLSKDLETVELDLVAGERGYRRPDVPA
ncbi:MAG TPA: formate dehydrogenase accessory protein FdhE [Burkholderiales bacterium]|nr:formate dehydrogenase accessory protein FdhE [Burkholderiales bacterium]